MATPIIKNPFSQLLVSGRTSGAFATTSVESSTGVMLGLFATTISVGVISVGTISEGSGTKGTKVFSGSIVGLSSGITSRLSFNLVFVGVADIDIFGLTVICFVEVILFFLIRETTKTIIITVSKEIVKKINFE